MNNEKARKSWVVAILFLAIPMMPGVVIAFCYIDVVSECGEQGETAKEVFCGWDENGVPVWSVCSVTLEKGEYPNCVNRFPDTGELITQGSMGCDDLNSSSCLQPADWSENCCDPYGDPSPFFDSGGTNHKEANGEACMYT